MEYKKFTGKDVNEAIVNACNTLGITSSDLEYKILSEGKQSFLSKEPAIVEVRKKQLNIQNVKNIEDGNLAEGDIIKHYCDKCDKNVLMKIMITPSGVVGMCSKCRGYKTLKKNENYTTETSIRNIPKCPTCQSTNIKRVSGTSKVVSVAVWGLLSQKVKKQFHCNNCGYEW